MAECTQCGKYTKFNGGLCFECYNNKEEIVVSKKENKKGESDDKPFVRDN